MCAAALALPAPALAQLSITTADALRQDLEDLGRLSIEELMTQDVTSVSGAAEEWFEAPAAIYVIGGDEVRRSGVRSLPEALRLAPGVFVGQSSSQGYSIGTRGFNGGLGNKTLVLIDGRAVYDPLFSGTFWNVQDVLMEDLERIEVIRGPGPTLWGANAVNGVINVITKSAKDTQGLYLSGGGGTYERAFGMVRYGGQIDENAWFRVYAKYFDRDELADQNRDRGHDDWNMFRGGFRFDLEGNDDIFFTVQGDAYHGGRIGESSLIPIPDASLVFEDDVSDGRNTGANVLFRLSKDSREDPSWMLQGYYDRTDRVQSAGFEVGRDTFDLEWRHRFQLAERHEITWGLGARHTRDTTDAGPTIAFDPSSRSLDTFTAFVQDTITLVPDRLFTMIGTKIEDNDLTGFEIQPSARIWWTPNDEHTLWAAVSRPVRVPSRIEEDGILTFGFADTGIFGGGPPSGVIVPLQITGDRDLDSEQIWAWETGYRIRPTSDLTLDFAIFYNDYDRLVFVPAEVVGSFNNDGQAETYGGEIAATWRPTDQWRLEASYSYVDVQVHGPINISDEGTTPHHQAQLRSYLDITDDLEFNGALYYVDDMPNAGVDSYLRMDAGLTWRPKENFEISIWGLNLLDARHAEFSSREVERAAYVQATFRF